MRSTGPLGLVEAIRRAVSLGFCVRALRPRRRDRWSLATAKVFRLTFRAQGAFGLVRVRSPVPLTDGIGSWYWMVRVTWGRIGPGNPAASNLPRAVRNDGQGQVKNRPDWTSPRRPQSPAMRFDN